MDGGDDRVDQRNPRGDQGEQKRAAEGRRHYQ